MEKYHIQANSVQETLVIPLYGRKLCSERFPALFKDDKAVELIDTTQGLLMSKKEAKRLCLSGSAILTGTK